MTQAPEKAKPGRNSGQAKTGPERVQKLRAGLKDKGAKRWELSPPPHPDDRPEIKAFAEKLARKRAKLAPPRAG